MLARCSVLCCVFLLLLSVHGLESAYGGMVKTPYLQNVKKNSITFMWETASANRGVVTVYKSGQEVRRESSERTLHEVVVDGLEPGQRYSYLSLIHI